MGGGFISGWNLQFDLRQSCRSLSRLNQALFLKDGHNDIVNVDYDINT